MALTDYTGAGSRLDPARGLALDPRLWSWQPKCDGVYARVSLDRRGRVSNVLSRAGSPLADARHLLGILAGPPDSVLHGELEAHTEAGNRSAACRGYRALHVFDVTRLHGRDCTSAPYIERHRALVSTRSDLVHIDTWSVDEQGDSHDLRTGRYVRPVPRDIRALPLVPLHSDADALWRSHVSIGGGEGLVAVRLDAPAGKRGSKRKIKATDTIDAVVCAIGGGAALLAHGGRSFAVSARGRWSALLVGCTVEVACDGWYERDATPRFARIVRVRADL